MISLQPDSDLYVVPEGPLFDHRLDGRCHRTFSFCALIVQKRGRLPKPLEISQAIGGSEEAAQYCLDQLAALGWLLSLEPLKPGPQDRIR